MAYMRRGRDLEIEGAADVFSVVGGDQYASTCPSSSLGIAELSVPACSHSQSPFNLRMSAAASCSDRQNS
jgi:hypothetical protein